MPIRSSKAWPLRTGSVFWWMRNGMPERITHLNKLIRQATFSDPGACLENVEYLPDRGLKREELLRFGTCNYI